METWNYTKENKSRMELGISPRGYGKGRRPYVYLRELKISTNLVLIATWDTKKEKRQQSWILPKDQVFLLIL